jgi:hypothetical protein
MLCKQMPNHVAARIVDPLHVRSDNYKAVSESSALVKPDIPIPKDSKIGASKPSGSQCLSQGK